MSEQDDQESVSSNASIEKHEKDDPWDLQPEFSEHPPHDTSSFCLDDDEQMLFYQRSRYPIHAYLAHTESEVVITKRRVIITQADSLRTPFANHWIYRMRQHTLARDKVAGYDAGGVQPKCCHLCSGLVLFFVGFMFLAMGDDAVWLALRGTNPLLWVRTFGGKPCRKIGLCSRSLDTQEPSSLMQLAPEVIVPQGSLQHPGALRQEERVARSAARAAEGSASGPPAMARPSSGTFLELRSSGTLLAAGASRRAGAQMKDYPVLSPGSSSPQSLLQTESPAKTYEGPPYFAYTGELKSFAYPGCANFPGWVDIDGADCSSYANPRWTLSCTRSGADPGANPEVSARFEERRDDSGLHLNALEACCACGGGQHVGRRVGVQRLVGALWPIVLAASSSGGKTAHSAAQISVAGKAVLTETFRNMDFDQLREAAKAVTHAHTGEIVAGILDVQPPLQKLIWSLAQKEEIAKVSKGLGDQPLPGLTMYALDLDMEGAKEQVENQPAMDRYASFARFQPIIVCALRALNCLLMFFGLFLCVKWCADQRSMDRLYIVLKLNRDYFGPPPDMRNWRPFSKPNHKVEELTGFYLPSASLHPYRLRLMANALMAPFEQPAQAVAPMAPVTSVPPVPPAPPVDDGGDSDSPRDTGGRKTVRSHYTTASGARSHVKFATEDSDD